jgi:hypothetical protein
MTEGHLTDEQLSSHLDEDPGPGVDETATSVPRDHLAGCASCRERLAALGSVRARLRIPVPPVPPHLRAASIASVLRTAGEGDPDSGAEAAAAAAAAAAADGAAAAEPVRIPARRRPQVLVGVAAAVLVLAALVTVPLALSGQTTSGPSATSSAKSATASTALSKSGQAASSHQAGASAAQGSSASAAITESLGEASSLAGLRSRVAVALAVRSATANAPEAGIAPSSTPGTTGTLNQFERCLPSAMHGAGPARILRLLSEVTFKGTPAFVYVFGPSSRGSSTGNAARSAVVVTARDGCRVLGITYL